MKINLFENLYHFADISVLPGKWVEIEYLVQFEYCDVVRIR